MPEHPSEVGNLLTQMINALAIRSNRTKGDTLDYLARLLQVSTDSIYKMRQGGIRPSNDKLARLVEIGVREAGMEYAWANGILTLSQHPRHSEILAGTFSPMQSGVRHNLPTIAHARFVGRDWEKHEIRQRLEPQSAHRIIPIEGVAGIGKTTLALEVASDYVEKYAELPAGRRYEAVIYTSAKRKVLTTRKIIDHPATLNNLVDAYRTILDILDDFPHAGPPDRRAAIQAIRVHGPVLLILDNLEAINSEDTLDFFWDFLADMPAPSKVLVPIRYHEDLPYPIRLGGLSDQEMAQFIANESAAREVPLTDEQVRQVIAASGGLPLAAWYAMGIMAMRGVAPEHLAMHDEQGQLAQYFFDEVLALLHTENPAAARVLIALSFFAPEAGGGATFETLASITSRDHETIATAQQTCRQALHQLRLFNLVSEEPDPESGGKRYTLLHFTQQVTQQKAVAKNDDGLRMRERWIKGYREWMEELRARPLAREEAMFREIGAEWKNLQELFAWLKQQRRVIELTWFWQQWPLLKFAEIQGHWRNAIDWLNDIRLEAERQNLPDIELLARVSMSRFEMMSGELDRAKEALSGAWEQREHLKHAPYGQPAAYGQVVLNYCMLLLRKDTLDEAARQMALLEADPAMPSPSEFSAYERENFLVELLCQQAKLAYLEDDLSRARELFERLLETCRDSGWERVGAYVRDYLANITFAQLELDKARELITEALAISTRFKYHHRIALLNKIKGQVDLARRKSAAASASTMKGAIAAIKEHLEKIDTIGEYADAARGPHGTATAEAEWDEQMNDVIRASVEQRQAPVQEMDVEMQRVNWVLADELIA